MVGRTDHTLCPVTAILDYIEVRSSWPEPFFENTNAKAITKPRFVQHIAHIAINGLPSRGLRGSQL